MLCLCPVRGCGASTRDLELHLRRKHKGSQALRDCRVSNGDSRRKRPCARRGGVADVEEPAAKRRRLRGKQPCAASDNQSQGASHPWQQGGLQAVLSAPTCEKSLPPVSRLDLQANTRSFRTLAGKMTFQQTPASSPPRSSRRCRRLRSTCTIACKWCMGTVQRRWASP